MIFQDKTRTIPASYSDMLTSDSKNPHHPAEGTRRTFLNRIAARLLRIRPPWASRGNSGSATMRERILLAVIFIGVMLSAVAFIPSVLLVIREGVWSKLIVDTMVLACGIGILTARGIGYEIRAWAASALIYAVGVQILFSFGFMSGGTVWLFAFGIVCGLLLGIKAAIVGIFINVITLGFLGWLHGSGGAVGEKLLFFATWPHAFAFGGSFIFLNILVAISCALLLEDERQTALSLRKEKSLLLETKRRLEQEIQYRKDAEKRQQEIMRDLEASEEQYRQLVNQAPAGIWEIDFKKDAITNVNAVMCGYTGYSRQEFMALHPLDLIAEESIEHFMERRRSILKGQTLPESTEYRIRRKDGTTFWVRSHSNVTYKEGTPDKATLVFHDISELKRLEKEKKDLEERLFEARKMEAIATLAGGVAHQFNNALSVVQGGLDMLRECMGYTEDQKRYIQMIRTSADRMAGLTNQLLAYAGGGKYYAQIISLSEFVKESLPSLLSMVPPSLRIETSLDDDAPQVKIDPNQMTFLLSSILTNASEALDGAGTVRIECTKVIIHVGNGKDHPELVPGVYAGLTIKDHGKGMDTETHRRVFEPFFSTKFLGRGLAMPAVLGIVKNHNGWIGIDSKPDQGTTVRIFLPGCGVDVPRYSDFR